MKLHSLEIQAFGPFADTQTINFDDLGDSPLFLIDGPTGAGKSSILHAICYALYGETTDEARKEIGLRCDHANDETLTQLSLRFSIAQQHYRITRIPTQMRKQKRGDGVTEQKSQAHLLKIIRGDDGEEIEQTLVTKKKTDADNQIKNIIGLTAEQFRQVMVLPQGKFRDLLLAKSDARQAIFSTLFQTEIYKYIEQILKDKAANIEREYKRFEERIKEYLQEVGLVSPELHNLDPLTIERLQVEINKADLLLGELNQDKTRLDKQKQTAQQQWQIAQKLADLFTKQARIEKQLEQHNRLQSQVDEQQECLHQADKAKQISNVYQSLQQLISDVKLQQQTQKNVRDECCKVKAQLAQSEELLKEAEQAHLSRDSLFSQIEQLKSCLQLQQQLSQQINITNGYQQQLQKGEKQLASLQAQHTEYLERSKKGEAYIVQLEQQIADKPRLELEYNQHRQTAQKLEQLQQLQLGLTKRIQQSEQEQQQQNILQGNYLQSEQAANQLEMQWFSNQAAVLAQTLQPGVACPVCGSNEHPQLAEPEQAQGLISKAQIEEARNKQKVASDALQIQSNQVIKTQAEITTFELQYQELKQTLDNVFSGDLNILTANDISHQLSQYQYLITGLQQQLADVTKTQATLQPAQQKLANMQAEIEPIELAIGQLQQQLPQLSEQFIIAQTSQKNLEDNIEPQYRQSEAINEALSQSEAKIAQIERQLKRAQQQKAEHENRVNGLSSQLAEIDKTLELTQNRMTEQQNKWIETLTLNGFNTQQQFAQALLNEQEHNTLRLAIEKHQQTKTELRSQLALLAEQLQDKTIPDLGLLQETVNTSTSLYTQAELAWAQQQTKLSKLQDIAQKIKQIETEQGDNKKQYEIIGTLAQAASGKGNVRVSLERFVLGDLLDSVLSIASKRLHIMSKGQYQLVRQNEDLQKRNVTAGLDLAIDDAYTGKTRPVATLSGGESFLASLALALGLSDVVQQRSGGIQLDTLFIDEGFGSLDQESLQLAIQTLIDLQASGRTIGIISHVSELKEQMALRIDVQQSSSGSQVSTFCSN